MGPNRNRPLILTIIFAVILFVLVIATSNTDRAKGPVSVLGGIVKPFQNFLYGIFEDVSYTNEENLSARELQERYDELLEKNTQYEEMLKDYQEIQKENERLRGLLNYLGEEETDIVTARVIGTVPGNWFDEFTINAGEDQGIRNNMIVYSKDGLIGKVIYTAGNYARVLSIMDDASGVSVLVERTRDNAVLSAVPGTDDTLELLYLRNDADIVPGDKVITSGLGGVFPKGIEIGTVTEVSNNTGGVKRAYIKSSVDFNHIEEVTIVLKVYEEVDE